jgi:hypothetical protein
MWPSAEHRPDGTRDVFGCCVRSEHAEGTHHKVAAGNAIEQALIDKPCQEVRCGLRRALAALYDVVRRERILPSAAG